MAISAYCIIIYRTDLVVQEQTDIRIPKSTLTSPTLPDWTTSRLLYSLPYTLKSEATNSILLQQCSLMVHCVPVCPVVAARRCFQHGKKIGSRANDVQ